MKSIFYLGYLLATAAGSLSAAANKCNADNCARAVTGTFNRLQTASVAACSSYQQCTVTPAISTVTQTLTVTPVATTSTYVATTLTVTVTGDNPSVTPVKRDSKAVRAVVNLGHKFSPANDIEARQVAGAAATTNCPTSLPSGDVAKYCTPASRYASACSCAGITRSYSTVAVPSTTVTATQTAVVSTTTTTITSTTTVYVTPVMTSTLTTSTSSSTTSAPITTSTSCSLADARRCDSKFDVCAVRIGDRSAGVCYYQFQCVACASDADCTAVPGGVNACVIDDEGFCTAGQSFCVVNDN